MWNDDFNSEHQIKDYDYDDEPNKFSVPIQDAIKFKDPISEVKISNNILLAASRNCILRCDLNKINYEIQTIEITIDKDDQVQHIFMDSEGCHSVISMQNAGENFYLHPTLNKARPLNSLQGLIEVVCWPQTSKNLSQLATQDSTGPFLIGMDNGCILEAHITLQEGLKYAKKLFKAPQAVTGIFVQRFSNGSFILFTTPTRLYQRFAPEGPAGSVYQKHFTEGYNECGEDSAYSEPNFRFIEFPRSFGFSILRFFPSEKLFDSEPQTMAWASRQGIYLCQLDFSSNQLQQTDSVLSQNRLIEYPVVQGEAAGHIVGMQLTDFHIIVAYGDRVKAINIVSEKVIYSHVIRLKSGEKILGLIKDPARGQVLLHSNWNIYPFNITEEKKNIWHVYLENNQFELALGLCDNTEQREIVKCRKADFLYEQKKYVEAANLYAETLLSFEEVALKFVQFSDKAGLETYLLAKLHSLDQEFRRMLKSTSVDSASVKSADLGSLPAVSVQAVHSRFPVLVVWLLDILLEKIGTGDSQTAGKQLHKLLDLPSVLECVKICPGIVYRIIENHSLPLEELHFAKLIGDHRRIVSHYISTENWSEALRALEMVTPIDEFFYRQITCLINRATKLTVNFLIAKGHSIDATRLLSSLISCPLDDDIQRYLQFVVEHLHCSDREVHNFYLLILARNKHEAKLLEYLESKISSSDWPFDAQYALRICSEFGLMDAAGKLHCLFDTQGEAVTEALNKNDIEAAKRIIKFSKSDSETQKKLWLKIARHVIEHNNDIDMASELIRECRLIELEDVLPFFKDFLVLGKFKDVICSSLDQYNVQIEQRKKNMKNAEISAIMIREQIQHARQRCILLQPNAECSRCNCALLSKAFYLFPCNHYFHTDCLIEVVKPRLSLEQRKRFSELTEILNGSRGQNVDTQIKTEIDNMIAADCCFCGELAINMVDDPLFDLETYSVERAKWS